MSHLGWRTQISMLWLLQLINLLAVIFISYFEAGLIADMTPEESGPALEAYFFLFAVLIWLAFALKPAVGRWIHMVFAALMIVVKVLYIVAALGAEYSGSLLFNEIWGLVAAALLIRVAWNAPKTDN